MELEEKKNKLLSEIEILTKQRNELVATLSGLRKEVSVHGGDYDEITAERIKVTNDLDEKFVTLKLETEKQTDERKQLASVNNNLQNSIERTESDIQKRETTKLKLKEEIENLTSTLDDLKISKQNEENEKRKTLRELKDELSETKEELRQHRKEIHDEKEEILKENRLLSIKRSDLEIYEARMRKKYPNDVFILK
jgi:chromosome segregation ATPase